MPFTNATLPAVGDILIVVMASGVGSAEQVPVLELPDWMRKYPPAGTLAAGKGKIEERLFAALPYCTDLPIKLIAAPVGLKNSMKSKQKVVLVPPPPP